MLAPYLAINDTTDMLSVYISEHDTAAMLANYALLSEAIGDVTKVGVPMNNQIVIWTGDGTIEGDADLTFDGTDLTTTGTVTSTGLIIGAAHITEPELEILDGALWSTAEGNQLVGITSDVIEANDTATMLTPYINRSDTSSMLTSYSRIDGTPVNNQVAIWTSNRNIEGDTLLLYDDGRLTAELKYASGDVFTAYKDGTTGLVGYGFQMKNDTGGLNTYGSIRVGPLNAESGNESGEYYFYLDSAGTVTVPLYLDTLGAYIGNGKHLMTEYVYFEPISTPAFTDDGYVYYDSDDDSLYLRTNSSWVALNREAGTGGGSGDVTKYETPVNNQLAVWRDDSTIEGEPNMTYDSTTYILHVVETLRVGSGTYIELADGGLSIGSANVSETEFEILDGATVTTSEINVLDDMTSSTTQLNYLNAATGTTGTTSSNVVFSASPTLTGTLTTALINIGGGGDIDSIQITDSDGFYLFQDGDTITPLSPASSETELEDEAVMLDDAFNFFTFGGGSNLPGDTIMFIADSTELGGFHHVQDTILPDSMIVELSTGDSLEFYIIARTFDATDADTLITAGTAVDEGYTVVSSFDVTAIPPRRYIYCAVKGTTATRKPVLFRSTFIYHYKRD
jgi:hypothetical protein